MRSILVRLKCTLSHATGYRPSDRYVTEDDELVLSCHVTGHPIPRTTWLKDHDKLPASPRFQSLTSEEGICEFIATSTVIFSVFSQVLLVTSSNLSFLYDLHGYVSNNTSKLLSIPTNLKVLCVSHYYNAWFRKFCTLVTLVFNFTSMHRLFSLLSFAAHEIAIISPILCSQVH